MAIAADDRVSSSSNSAFQNPVVVRVVRDGIHNEVRRHQVSRAFEAAANRRSILSLYAEFETQLLIEFVEQSR